MRASCTSCRVLYQWQSEHLSLTWGDRKCHLLSILHWFWYQWAPHWHQHLIPHVPGGIIFKKRLQDAATKTKQCIMGYLVHRVVSVTYQWYSNMNTIVSTLCKVYEAPMCLRQCSLIPPDLVWETGSLIPSEWRLTVLWFFTGRMFVCHPIGRNFFLAPTLLHA